MRRKINIAGLRWSFQEIIGIAVGFVVTITIMSCLSTRIEERTFLSSLAVVVTAIAVLIAALSLKRTIDTVRPFLTLSKTELSLDKSIPQAVMRLNVRNTGLTPAEQVSISFVLIASEGNSSKRELLSQTTRNPTIFPGEDRVITYYPRPELLELIETSQPKLTIEMTYHSAQKKYHTTRTMNILKAGGLDEGKFIFGFTEAEDSWD